MKRSVHYLLLLLCCTAIAACTTTEQRKGPVISAHSILLLQPESLHEELAGAGLPVYNDLSNALQKKRFSVLTTTAEQYNQAVDQALATAGAMYDPAIGKFLPLDRRIYIKSLIDYYAAQHEFEVLIMPELLIRTAEVRGDDAYWDNTERKIELHNKPSVPYRPLRAVRGVSLKLSVYSRNGADLLQSYAGIALPYRVDYNVQPPLFIIKNPLFTEREQQQAVDAALKPVFLQVKYHAKR